MDDPAIVDGQIDDVGVGAALPHAFSGVDGQGQSSIGGSERKFGARSDREVSQPPHPDSGGIQRAEEPVGFGRVEAAVLQHHLGHQAQRVEADIFRMSAHVRVEGLQRVDALREIVSDEGGGGIEGIASRCRVQACRQAGFPGRHLPVRVRAQLQRIGVELVFGEFAGGRRDGSRPSGWKGWGMGSFAEGFLKRRFFGAGEHERFGRHPPRQVRLVLGHGDRTWHMRVRDGMTTFHGAVGDDASGIAANLVYRRADEPFDERIQEGHGGCLVGGFLFTNIVRIRIRTQAFRHPNRTQPMLRHPV